MTELHINTFEKLPVEYADQALAIAEESYERSPIPTAEHFDKYCSTPFAWVLAIDNDKVIGRTKLFKREITSNHKSVLLGGIGGVYTKVAYRKKGIATAMLKRAMQKLKNENCDIAYLCTNTDDPKLVHLYNTIGFVLLNKPYVFQGGSGKLYEENEGMIAPLCSQEVFEEILASKEKFHLGVGNW